MSTECEQYLIEFTNKRILLSYYDKRLSRILPLLFQDMCVSDTDTADIIASIDVVEHEKDGESLGWRIKTQRFFESEFENKYADHKVSSEDELCFHLLDAVLYYWADFAKEGHMIHAACVSKNNKSILLPGSSGAGKSTLMTWLLKKGFEYQTDELVYIDKDLAIEPFRRSIQIKSYGYDIVEKVLGVPKLFSSNDSSCEENNQIVKGESFAILPWQFINASNSRDDKENGEIQLSAIIFPKYSTSQAFTLNKLTPANTTMQLMSCHINARNLKGHGIKDIAKLSREIPAYQLIYSDFKELEDELIPLLDSIC